VAAAGIYAVVCGWTARDLWFWWDEISLLRAQRVPRFELQGFLGTWLPGGRVVFQLLQQVLGNSYGWYVGLNAVLAVLAAILVADSLSSDGGALQPRSMVWAVTAAFVTSTSALSNVMYAAEAGRWLSILVVLSTMWIERRTLSYWITPIAITVSGIVWLSSALPMAIVASVLARPDLPARRKRRRAAVNLTCALAITIVGRAVAGRFPAFQEPVLADSGPAVGVLVRDVGPILGRSVVAWVVHVLTPIAPGLWSRDDWARRLFDVLLPLRWFVVLAIALVVSDRLLRRRRIPGVFPALGLLGITTAIVARGWGWLGTGPELRYGNVTAPLAIAFWCAVWAELRRRTSPASRWSARVLATLAISVVIINVAQFPRTVSRLAGTDWHVGSAAQKRALAGCVSSDDQRTLVVYPNQSGEELCEFYLDLED